MRRETPKSKKYTRTKVPLRDRDQVARSGNLPISSLGPVIFKDQDGKRITFDEYLRTRLPEEYRNTWPDGVEDWEAEEIEDGVIQIIEQWLAVDAYYQKHIIGKPWRRRKL